MKNRMKTLLVGSLPVVCSLSAIAARGEKIAWPEAPSKQHSFQLALSPAKPATTEPSVGELQVRVVELPALRKQEEPMEFNGRRQ